MEYYKGKERAEQYDNYSIDELQAEIDRVMDGDSLEIPEGIEDVEVYTAGYISGLQEIIEDIEERMA